MTDVFFCGILKKKGGIFNMNSPASIFAGIFGFEKVDYFEAQAGAENAPEVSFE